MIQKIGVSECDMQHTYTSQPPDISSTSRKLITANIDNKKNICNLHFYKKLAHLKNRWQILIEFLI